MRIISFALIFVVVAEFGVQLGGRAAGLLGLRSMGLSYLSVVVAWLPCFIGANVIGAKTYKYSRRPEAGRRVAWIALASSLVLSLLVGLGQSYAGIGGMVVGLLLGTSCFVLCSRAGLSWVRRVHGVEDEPPVHDTTNDATDSKPR
jgi:hypothetical protein